MTFKVKLFLMKNLRQYSTFVYKPTSMKIYMDANIMKTQSFKKII